MRPNESDLALVFLDQMVKSGPSRKQLRGRADRWRILVFAEVRTAQVPQEALPGSPDYRCFPESVAVGLNVIHV